MNAELTTSNNSSHSNNSKRWITLIVLSVVISLFLSAAGLAVFMKRERSIAVHAASNAVHGILSDRNTAARYGVPQKAVGSPFQIEDVDLFERQWSVFITLEKGGHFEVLINASRGIGFFPLFNRAKDLKVKAIQYGE
jgi:hypothetical protein